MKIAWQKLLLPVGPEKIALFRIFFAIVLFLQALYFQLNHFIQKDVIDPAMHFSYPYLEFISIPEPYILKSFIPVLFISSILIAIGYKARIFSFIYLLFFTYLWLIDKGYYNNHYYLISLLLFLLSLIRSDQGLSVNTKATGRNYAWEEYILLFQFSLVLLYAGFNKLNEWWLFYHEPVHHILEAKAIMGTSKLWLNPLLEYILVWGGLLFDLAIVPLLLWKRTRKIAIVLFISFNAINTLLFYDIGEIGIFPLLMIASLILFIPDEKIKAILVQRFNYKKKAKNKAAFKKELSPLLKLFIISYFFIQLLLPLRHHLYPENVDYSGEGQRFSWRMKSVYKDFEITFRLVDEEQGISAELDPRQVLTVKQYTNLGYYPELILPVADDLKKAALKKGIADPKVYVEYKVGFMGLPMQYIVDPKLELSGLTYSPFRHSTWILPLIHE